MEVFNLRTCRSCGGDLCVAPVLTEIPAWLTSAIIAIQERFVNLLSVTAASLNNNDHTLGQVGLNAPRFNRHVAARAPADLTQKLAMLPNTTFTEARDKLSGAMRTIDLSRGDNYKKRIKIAVGIEAHHLFGKETGLVCSHLTRCQNLFGTTIWSPGKKLFRDALQRTWYRQDFLKAYKWIQSFGAKEPEEPQ